MALGKYNRRTVMADTGAVISGATVSFYDQLSGLPVTAYSDPDGLDPLGSSVESGENGEVEVFLPPGKYRITTELGSYSDEITYEPVVGDLAVIDATDVTNGLFLLDVPAETSFIRVLASGYSDLRTVVQVKTDLGLENVSNTSDANKPISTATQTALNLKADLTDPRFTDSREWAAETVDQTEAETGTSTTRRAWTAERVRQAINAVGTNVGKSLLNLADPSAQRLIRINSDNSVSSRNVDEFRSDIGLDIRPVGVSGAISNATIHEISGVMRYYPGTGAWDLLYNQGEGHTVLGVSSVVSDTTKIRINFDTTGHKANASTCSFLVTPDETLAQRGVFCGSSVTTTYADVYLSASVVSDYISYNGTAWTSLNGHYTGLTFTAGNLAITPRHRNIHYVYPMITTRYNGTVLAQLDSISTSTINIKFVDRATGALVTTPSTDMRFYIVEPGANVELDPHNDRFQGPGNLWFTGRIITWD